MKLGPVVEAIARRRLALLVLLASAGLAAMAIFVVPPGFVRLALAVLLALPLFFLFVDRPTIVFYLLIFILFSNLDILVAPVRLYRYVLMFFIASFAVSVASGRRIVSHHPLMVALVASFTILAFQSMSVARELNLSIERLGALLKILLGLAIVAQFVRDRVEFRRFILVVAAGTLLSSLLPFVLRLPSQFSSMSVLWNEGILRYEGFILGPNTFAMYQNFLIPVLIFLFGVYRKPIVARPIFLAAICASVFVLILSFSRGGFVGLVCILALLVVLERRNAWLLLSGVVVLAVGLVLVPGLYWERVRSMIDVGSGGRSDFAIVTRIETMRTAVRLGLQHPFLGVGIDNFIPRSAYFIPYRLVVHNSFLQIFSELGGIASLVLISIIAYNVVIMVRLMGRRGDREAVLLGRALFMQQVAVMINSLFIPVAYEMIFWFALGLPVIADYAYRSRREDEAVIAEGRIPSA